ncbi:hypothetical protein PspLS_10629 [Pyricularia sp. CBS 133598]|nr:hypothetical protein PspLS_10629 [Pyricularia sp. CBS 133598]
MGGRNQNPSHIAAPGARPMVTIATYLSTVHPRITDATQQAARGTRWTDLVTALKVTARVAPADMILVQAPVARPAEIDPGRPPAHMVMAVSNILFCDPLAGVGIKRFAGGALGAAAPYVAAMSVAVDDSSGGTVSAVFEKLFDMAHGGEVGRLCLLVID